MPKPTITSAIKLQADAIVARFNAEQLRGKPWAHYVTNYRGMHLYLSDCSETCLMKTLAKPTASSE